MTLSFRSVWVQFITVLYTIASLVLLPFLSIFLVFPAYLYRSFVYGCSRIFGPVGIAGMIGQLCGLHAVDNLNSKPFGNLLVALYFEDDKFDLDALRNTFVTKVLNKVNSKGELEYPELQQVVCSFMGYSFWKWGPFEAENHCSIYKPAKGEIMNEAALTKLREKLVLRPWKKDRPVWEAVIVQNFQSDEYPNSTVLLFLAHHLLMDGYSIINILVEDYTAVRLDKVIPKPIGYSYQTLGRISRTLSEIAWPIRAIYEFAGVLQRKPEYNAWHQPNARFNRNGQFSYANSISVDYIKEIKNSHGVSFTAVLFSAICAGIRNGLKAEGAEIPVYVDILAVIPMPGHPKKLTNHLSHATIQLPTGNACPRSRLLEIDGIIQKTKSAATPLLNFLLSRFLGDLPRCIIRRVINQKLPVTLAISNFPAPIEKMWVQGTRIYRVEYNAGPMLAIPLGFSCLTYNGKASIFCGVDSSIPGFEKISTSFVEYFKNELDLLHQTTSSP